MKRTAAIRFRRSAAAAALVLACACVWPAQAYTTPQIWEQTATLPAQAVDQDAEPEISVSSGIISVRTRRQVTVQIFTILGQPVSRYTLQPSSWRLRLRGRGIYILKCDNTTRRITV